MCLSVSTSRSSLQQPKVVEEGEDVVRHGATVVLSGGSSGSGGVFFRLLAVAAPTQPATGGALSYLVIVWFKYSSLPLWLFSV